MSQSIQVQLVESDRYSCILKDTHEDIDFHFVHSALRYHVDGRLKDVKLSLFEVVDINANDSGCKYYCVVHEILGKSIKFLINTNSHDEDYLRMATMAVLKKIHPILDQYPSFYSAYIRKDIREILQIYFNLNPTHPHYALNEPLHCFYMSNEQCQRVIDMNIELPDGYKFVELNVEDAKQICQEQLSTSENDEKFIGYRLANFSAVGVISTNQINNNNPSGRLICYEHSDGVGTLALLYCQLEHRGRGLASRVEERLCQRNLIDQKIRPFKGVSTNRPRVIQMTTKSDLWSVLKDPNGGNESFVCTSWNKYPIQCVVMYED